MDHLHLVHKSGHHLWEYPKKPDLCEVDLLQVLGIEPQHQWLLENLRNPKMELKNFKEIDHAVQKKQLNISTD